MELILKKKDQSEESISRMLATQKKIGVVHQKSYNYELLCILYSIGVIFFIIKTELFYPFFLRDPLFYESYGRGGDGGMPLASFGLAAIATTIAAQYL